MSLPNQVRMLQAIAEQESLEGEIYGYHATVQFTSVESFRDWMARDHQSAFRAKFELWQEAQRFSLAISPQEYPDANQKILYRADITLSTSVTLSRNRLAKAQCVKLRKLSRSLLLSAFLIVPLSNSRGSLSSCQRGSGISIYGR